MFQRILHMIKKEFIQIFRDSTMKVIIFVMPVLQVLIFGYAVTTDVKNVATAIRDLDNSVVSRELRELFSRSGYFNIVEQVYDEDRVRELLDRGQVNAVLHIAHGFAEDLNSGKSAQLQVILDGTDSNTAGIVLNYTASIVSQYSQKILITRFTRANGLMSPPSRITLKTRTWFNENLESRNFYIPGVVALLLTLITLMLTSMAVVREKEIGTMEQIMVTPITPSEFILGKTVPFALMGFLDVIISTVVAVFWFDVPLRGNLLLLFFATLLYLMPTLGVGLLISTMSQTQQQAMMSTVFFYFPTVLLSGFMFPIASMPEPVQWFTYLDPLRYFLVILRGIFLKGVGFDILWPQLASLAVMGVITLTLASRKFHKTLQ